MAYILIVDDDEDFGAAVEQVMRGAGHEVLVMTDTKGVLDEMKRRKPDLAILDVMFPEDSAAGFTLARSIAQRNEFQKIPLLLLTAVNEEYPLGFSEKDIDKSWMPVNAFLEKPIDFNVLLEKVSKLLENSALSANT